MNLSRMLMSAMALGLAAPVFATGCYEQRNRSIELMNQGVEAGRQKLFDTAVRDLKQAAETDPSNHLAWFNLGVIYKDQKKWDLAANAFKEAAKLQEGNATYHYEYGNALQEAAAEARRVDPTKPMAPADEEKALNAAAKKLEDAKSEYQLALNIQRSYKTHFRLGTVFEAQEKYKEADAEYRKAIEMNPRFPEPFIRLGNLYLDHDYDQEAVKVFSEAAKVNDSSGDAHMGLAEALQQTKQYDEAVKEFKKALEHNGELFMAVYDIGMTYKMMDDKKDAREWLSRFVQNAGTKGTPELLKAANDAIYQLDAP